MSKWHGDRSSRSDSPGAIRPPGTRGRWSQADENQLLFGLQGWIRSELDSRAEFTYEDIEKRFRITPARARTVVAQLDEFLQRLKVGSNGIHAIDDRASYYWSQAGRHRDLKNAIASKTSSLIEPNASLACSAGTTVTRTVGRILEEEHFYTVLTNNCGLFDRVGYRRNSTIELTGGTYNASLHAFEGVQVIDQFEKRKCRYAIIGLSGFDSDGRLYVKHPSEIGIFQAIVKCATDQVFIVASVDKLAQSDAHAFGSIFSLKEGTDCEVTLITNALSAFPDPDERLKERARGLFERFEDEGLLIVSEEDVEEGGPKRDSASGTAR